MTGWPDRPVIYEINTAVWLNALGRAAGRPVTLADVAATDWDSVTPAGVVGTISGSDVPFGSNTP